MRLNNDSAWHQPITTTTASTSSLMTSQLIHKSSKAPTMPIAKSNLNSSMPFRELLLQQQQTKLLAASSKNSLDSLATMAGGGSGGGSGVGSSGCGGGAVNIATTANLLTAANSSSAAYTANEMPTLEHDRLAMATHFQERDRLILQHQQHQLQRKQKHKHHEQDREQHHHQQQQLDEHKKPFSGSNRIQDCVIGGVDRAANIASGKTSGK